MRAVITLLLLLIPIVANSAILYVDQLPAESGSSWNGVNGTSYSGTPGSGTGYSTLQAAFAAMSTGDKVYLRGGTYSEDFGNTYTAMELPLAANGTAWTEGNYSYVGSYPGEWAIIAHDYSKICAFGRCDSGNGGASDIRAYWMIERLEFTGGLRGGLGIWEGPVKVQYCYIHDNRQTTTDENPCGFRSYRLKNSEIKYCLFDDNGTTAVSGSLTNCGHLEIVTGFYLDGETRANFDFANATHSNEIAYNYFLNTNGYATGGALRHKGRQYLGNTTSDTTYQAYGDEWHHNYISGDYNYWVMEMRQDFGSIHNNIVYTTSDDQTAFGAAMASDSNEESRVIYQTWYNNTFIGTSISWPEAYIDFASPITNTNSCVNNIIDGFNADAQGYGVRAISFYRGYNSLDPSQITYSAVVDRNFLHDITNSDTFQWGTDNVADRDRTTAEFNSAYSVNNYENDNSGLYQAGVITDPTFIVDGGTTTIADGGLGASYPSYIGATNPSDYSWVTGVTGLNVSYFTSVTAGTDPSWVENGTPDTTPPTLDAITIQSDGNSTQFDFSENMQVGGDGYSGWTTLNLSGGAVTLSNCAATNDVVECSNNRTVSYGETFNSFSYTQPGDGLQDTATTPNNLASIISYSGAFSNDVPNPGATTSYFTSGTPATFGSGTPVLFQ